MQSSPWWQISPEPEFCRAQSLTPTVAWGSTWHKSHIPFCPHLEYVLFFTSFLLHKSYTELVLYKKIVKSKPTARKPKRWFHVEPKQVGLVNRTNCLNSGSVSVMPLRFGFKPNQTCFFFFWVITRSYDTLNMFVSVLSLAVHRHYNSFCLNLLSELSFDLSEPQSIFSFFLFISRIFFKCIL